MVSRRQSARSGFTLIELSVVVATVAVLIILLLPALQKVREAANRAQCTNNMKHLGLAMMEYYSTFGGFPQTQFFSDGCYGGGPPCTMVCWGWLPKLLPYLEQNELFKLINFQNSYSCDTFRPARQTFIPTFSCPSDPNAGDTKTYGHFGNSAIGYPGVACGNSQCIPCLNGSMAQIEYPQQLNPALPNYSKYDECDGQATCYYGSAGDSYNASCGRPFSPPCSGCDPYSTGGSWQAYHMGGDPLVSDGAPLPGQGFFASWVYGSGLPGGNSRGYFSFQGNGTNCCTPPMQVPISISDVTDGVSNTIMIGHQVSNGANWRAAWYEGKMVSSTSLPPNFIKDAMVHNYHVDNPPSGLTGCLANSSYRKYGFNSFHPGCILVTMGDASVRVIAENINQVTYNALGSRAGGEPLGDF